MNKILIKALYEYHGIDPSTYVLGTKDTTEVNGSGTEQNTEVSNGSEQNTEVDNGSEDITNRGQYTTDEALDGVPRTPGNYTDDEQPPEKRKKLTTTHSTPLALRKPKRKRKRKVIYSSSL